MNFTNPRPYPATESNDAIDIGRVIHPADEAHRVLVEPFAERRKLVEVDSIRKPVGLGRVAHCTK